MNNTLHAVYLVLARLFRPFAYVVLVATMMVPWARADDYVVDDNTVLLPVWKFDPIPGGNGSMWLSELRVLNVSGSSLDPIKNLGSSECPATCAPVGEWMPRNVSVSAFAVKGVDPVLENPGAMLFVRPGSTVAFQLRIRDISRDAERRGTALPVVRRNEALSTTMHLIGIPVDARYRYTFRAYSFTRLATRAKVRVYATNPDPAIEWEQTGVPDPLITEFTVNLQAGHEAVSSYGAFGELSSLVDPAVHREVRLEVEPENGIPIWAMLSITNNVTQEFTLVLPNRN